MHHYGTSMTKRSGGNVVSGPEIIDDLRTSVDSINKSQMFNFTMRNLRKTKQAGQSSKLQSVASSADKNNNNISLAPAK